MTDLPAVKSGKGQKDSATTYEQALLEYESELMSMCYGTCHGGCPACFALEPEPPNPEDYLDEGKR